MSLVMSIRSRGPAGSAARTKRVLSRFGPTAAAMTRHLDRYDAIAAELGARPTWPTTACVLRRHPELLKRYADRGAELAVHGLVHGDHAALDEHRQRETIGRAMEIFERAGIHATGFRGPYLRYNQATLDVLRELGFLYHSSQAVVFPPQSERSAAARSTPSYDLALELYSAVDARRVAVTPRLRDGLVDIPVAIPDDEIIVERLRLDSAGRAAEWAAILDLTHQRGDLFTLQLHPERIPELAAALRATLVEARQRRPAVFIARLDAIAEWWLRRSRFVLHVTRVADGIYRVHLDADDDATLLVRGAATGGELWHGVDVVCPRRDFEIASARMPMVAVSRRTRPEVRQFLREEGFRYEVSDDAAAYGASVDLPAATWSERGLLDSLEAAPGPLVRIWRWPRGARSALAVTGDIDALTLADFALRSWETREHRSNGRHRS
jgi:peptidoglycan/xylan/chitin deacetylase (PgdA/CDA1 family)